MVLAVVAAEAADAEVVAAWADPRVFTDGRWHFADDALRSIHYLAGGSFLVLADTLARSAMAPQPRVSYRSTRSS